MACFSKESWGLVCFSKESWVLFVLVKSLGVDGLFQ